MGAALSGTFWLSIGSSSLNFVAQFHLVELMHDFSSLAAFTFGGDMQILTCFKFLLVLTASDLHFPPENKRRLTECVTASIPFDSTHYENALYICILHI